MIRRTLRFGLLALLLAVGAAQAQEAPTVRAFVQPEQGIAEDTSVSLVVQVEGASNTKMSRPRLGALKNLKVVGGPDSRVSSVWNNGRFSSTSQWVYTLLPEQAGPAEVPPIEIRLGTRVLRTSAIRFDVARASSAPAPTPAAPPRAGAGSSPRTSRPESETPSVFVKAELGATRAWVGQSVPLTLELYTAERIYGQNLVDQPSLSSFWVEDLEVDPDAESTETTIDGTRYLVFPMQRKVLVPQAPGTVEIEPYALQLQVRRRRGGDPFDLFNLGRAQNIVRKTRALKLDVRSLPEDGRPEEFSGAVGSFKLLARVDRTEADVNQAVALTAVVEGDGSLRYAQAPVFDAPADITVFAPKVTSTNRTVRGKLRARKSWEWVLVPRVPGVLDLGDVRFHYFEPGRGVYTVIDATPRTIEVVRGAQESEGGSVARTDVRLQRKDLAFIKSLKGPLRPASPRAHERWLFLLLLGAPLVWVPAVVALGRHRARLQRNLGLARGRRARSRARKRLRAAERRVGDDESGEFHEQVARALVDYVADRFDRSAAGLTYDMAESLLASKGVDEELRRRYRACLETCDFARFVPETSKSERRSEVHSEAMALVDALEKAW